MSRSTHGRGHPPILAALRDCFIGKRFSKSFPRREVVGRAESLFIYTKNIQKLLNKINNAKKEDARQKRKINKVNFDYASVYQWVKHLPILSGIIPYVVNLFTLRNFSFLIHLLVKFMTVDFFKLREESLILLHILERYVSDCLLERNWNNVEQMRVLLIWHQKKPSWFSNILIGSFKSHGNS